MYGCVTVCSALLLILNINKCLVEIEYFWKGYALITNFNVKYIEIIVCLPRPVLNWPLPALVKILLPLYNVILRGREISFFFFYI